MKIIKNLFQETIYFKLLYLLFALCSIVPFVNQYTGDWFKFVLVYGWLILLYDLFTRRRFLTNRYLPWIAIFLGILLVTTVVNYDKSLVENGKMMAYTVLQFLLLANIDLHSDKRRTKREILLLNQVAILGISLISLASIVLFLLRINGAYFTQVGTEYESMYYFGVAYGNRLTGITANPNTLGIVGLIAIAAMFINRRLFPLSRTVKVLYILAFLVNFACFIMAGSRGAEVGAIVFFLVYLYFSWVKKLKKRSLLVIKHMAVFCAALVLVGTVYLCFKPIRRGLGYLPASIALMTEAPEPGLEDETAADRLERYHVNLQRDTSSESQGNGRIALWKASAVVVKHHPLAGVGKYDVKAYFRKYMPNASLPGLEGGGMHNILIQTVVSYGIFALPALLLLLFMIAKDAVKIMYHPATRKTRYSLLTAVISAVLLLFSNNMVEANILYTTSFMNCFFMLYLGYLMYFLQKDVDTASPGALAQENSAGEAPGQ
ncbi:MAG: O-antigen ligase family protein [Oscillospiraceae bacterium]